MAYSYISYPHQARKTLSFKNTRIMDARTHFLLPVDLLSKIAQALGVSEAELFGTEEPKAKRGPASGRDKRVEVIKSLPTDKQREIRNVVDALLASQGKSAA